MEGFSRRFASCLNRCPDPDHTSRSILDGRIDLGVLAAEFLALGLDPYPRKPGADFAAPAEADISTDSPFAALRQLARPRRGHED